MTIYKKIIFALAFLIFQLNIFGQTINFDSIISTVKKLDKEVQIDSLIIISNEYVYDYPSEVIDLNKYLLDVIGNTKNLESKKSKILIINSVAFLVIGEYDESINNAKQSEEIALKENKPENLSEIYNQLGVIYYYKGEYEKTEEYWLLELEKNREIGNAGFIAQNLSNLGVIAKNNGNYDKAIENYQAALKVQEEMSDNEGMAITISNLGNIYFHFRGNYEKALENYKTGLKLYKKIFQKKDGAEIHNKIGDTYNNIGLIYNELKDYKLAKEYLDSALNTFELLNNEEKIIKTQGNLGFIYAKLGNFITAEKYCINYLNYNKKIKNSIEEGLAYEQLGLVYMEWGKYYKSLQNFKKCLGIFLHEDLKPELVNTYKYLSQIESKTGNFKNAYTNHVAYSELKDSLFSEEKQKQISELETKYETEKKERQIELLNKDKALQDATLTLQEAALKRQRLVIIFFVVGFAALAFFAIVILRLFRQKQKANIALEEKNHEISLQRDQIFQQKEEITSSIEYASRIQTALLPPKELFQEVLPDSFIFFRPRDIVSGDYYWLNKKEHKIISVTADCTGHGVPGAFMSMLGVSFLNEIVNIRSVEELHANEILGELRDLVISSLRQTGKEGESRDGMDMTICIIDTNTFEMEFAGAYNPLYLIRNGELIEYKPDKSPIGIHVKRIDTFTNHIIKLEEGDLLYTFSDGYADQFGGPNNQKFRRKTFKELLLEIHTLDMLEQKRILAERHDEWKKGYSQVDDVLVSGIKITKSILG